MPDDKPVFPYVVSKYGYGGVRLGDVLSTKRGLKKLELERGKADGVVFHLDHNGDIFELPAER